VQRGSSASRKRPGCCNVRARHATMLQHGPERQQNRPAVFFLSDSLNSEAQNSAKSSIQAGRAFERELPRCHARGDIEKRRLGHTAGGKSVRQTCERPALRQICYGASPPARPARSRPDAPSPSPSSPSSRPPPAHAAARASAQRPQKTKSTYVHAGNAHARHAAAKAEGMEAGAGEAQAEGIA